MAEKHFPGRFGHEALKSQFDRLRKTYQQIKALMDWTGGGGDPDLEKCFKSAKSSRSTSLDLKGLSPGIIKKWTVTNPWLYELFDNRLVN